jgi:hypothetical protein
MTIEEGLFAYLAGRPEITNVIGSSPTRFYPVVAPQNPIAPFVAYQRANATRERAASGPTGAAEAVYNLTCWAETYPQAAALARLLRNELDGVTGWWGGIELGSVQADDTRDDFNGDLQLFGRLVVLTVQYREA